MTIKVLAIRLCSLLLLAAMALAATSCTAETSNAAGGYQDLLALFEDWPVQFFWIVDSFEKDLEIF